MKGAKRMTQVKTSDPNEVPLVSAVTWTPALVS